MYGNEIRGLTEFFDGAMSTLHTVPTTAIVVIETAAFTHLTMTDAPVANSTDGISDPTTITFPAGYTLWNVTAFQLATGSIQAYYKTNNV